MCKKRHVWEKNIFGILLHLVVKIEKYLPSIMYDSAITCDEIIESYDEEIKAIPTNSNEKKGTCKTQNFLIFTVI